MIRHTLFATALLSATLLASTACSAQSPAGKPFKETVVVDFESPWAMAVLPDGNALITEKDGRMVFLILGSRTANGSVVVTMPVAGIPKIDSAGQGALMDVVLAPDYARSHLVYFSGSITGAGGKGVALWRGKLALDNPGPRLEGVEELFRARPFVAGNGHYSGRIAFSPDGKYLFFTNGERQKFTPAQDPKVTLGKVLRLTLDGKPAPGNPLVAKGFAPEIWSYGHRNLLGIAFDAQGNLWEQEMGPKGGDEVNLIKPGLNYGWPNASDGSNYDGTDIPDHMPGDGYEPPKVFWNPVISPGGLMIYSGSMFPQWKGDAFIGGLSSKSLVRVDLNGTNAAKGDQWDMRARIRDVEQGPDGAIWVLEDGGESQGRLIKLTAK
ncbi:MAG TPA: PQQ-dependent sugar dehydrogenase [Sphingomonas sp.]|nr:PQQ-dependent sugar dehydrogenase [Sphingomonas sp.]